MHGSMRCVHRSRPCTRCHGQCRNGMRVSGRARSPTRPLRQNATRQTTIGARRLNPTLTPVRMIALRGRNTGQQQTHTLFAQCVLHRGGQTLDSPLRRALERGRQRPRHALRANTWQLRHQSAGLQQKVQAHLRVVLSGRLFALSRMDPTTFGCRCMRCHGSGRGR